MRLKNAALFILGGIIFVTMTSCADKDGDNQSGVANVNNDNQEETMFYNYHKPGNDDEIVVIKVEKYGDMAFRLFPEQAPKGVENFVGLAKEGYYKGKSIHRVIQDFMIQGGSLNGDGTGGESIWGGMFGVEASDKLYHFYGALCYANAAGNNSCQFYIVNRSKLDNELLSTLEAYGYTIKNETVKEKYLEVGGTPELDGEYTVFGQMLSGPDVLNKITEVETTMGGDGAMSKPVKDIIIEDVQVIKYSEYLESNSGN